MSTETDDKPVSQMALSWWQDIRIRFGILLALSLLPWLVFTLLQTFSEVEENRLQQSRTQDIIAEKVVLDSELLLGSGQLGLEFAMDLLETQGCQTTGRLLFDQIEAFDTFLVYSNDGEQVCQVGEPVLYSLDARPEAEIYWLGRAERNAEDNNAAARETSAIMLSRINPVTGQTFVLGLPASLGMREVLDATLGGNSAISLVRQNGTVLSTTSDLIPEADWFVSETALMAGNADDPSGSRLGAESLAFLNVALDSGRERRIVSTFSNDLNLHIAVSRDINREDFWAMINPISSVFLPVLAWIIGFTLIWLGTRSMMLKPIAQVRRTAHQFSRGNMDARVQLSDAAAREMQGLAMTLNRMAAQLDDRDKRLADNIDEKDILMREIHHRVKNNLQIIISLLNMQERKVESEEAIDAIAETRARINAISIVHRGLYESDDLRRIDVRPFVSRLLGALADSLGTDEMGIDITHSVAECQVPADSAIPIALFIVEAVSNATYHGVERGGQIDVTIAKSDEAGDLIIEISDNGCGMGDPTAMRGVGVRLMKGFARQLSGDLTFKDNQPGLVASLSLPTAYNMDEPFRLRREQSRRAAQE